MNSDGDLVPHWNPNAEVEELQGTICQGTFCQGQHWTRADMSPVNYLHELYYFTAASMGSNLYIFGICRNIFEERKTNKTRSYLIIIASEVTLVPYHRNLVAAKLDEPRKVHCHLTSIYHESKLMS